ncbi:sulfurtransferase [Erythrobacter sp. SDW2]|uniref:sulfurtransferase n=1 Tax=Erythrobacter sp. SDW2 TaxID=2907154 RepID=UPI001F233F41|nr:sulfurtransferase [Erythrobacter sp. SDW2]UIP06461.1 sulfurtransferase [Erythrobacter sp. SDW2]
MEMLVSTDWLAGELGADDLVVLDASLHLPGTGRNAGAEFEAAHLPGARFLDLAALHDPQSSMPGKVPDAARLETRLTALGVTNSSRLILYDDSALRSACRAWFLLKVFGFEQVAVLDGGLGKWRNEGRPLENDVPVEGAEPGLSITLVADRAILRDKNQVLANCAVCTEQVVDARDEGRFTGATVDTVHNLPGGHIPRARNVPFTSLLNPNGTFRSLAELRATFEAAGLDLSQSVVTSCGSGVTASVLVFALHLIGKTDVALYDGSWSEWGADPATPKETGEAH